MDSESKLNDFGKYAYSPSHGMVSSTSLLDIQSLGEAIGLGIGLSSRIGFNHVSLDGQPSFDIFFGL